MLNLGSFGNPLALSRSLFAYASLAALAVGCDAAYVGRPKASVSSSSGGKTAASADGGTSTSSRAEGGETYGQAGADATTASSSGRGGSLLVSGGAGGGIAETQAGAPGAEQGGVGQAGLPTGMAVGGVGGVGGAIAGTGTGGAGTYSAGGGPTAGGTVASSGGTPPSTGGMTPSIGGKPATGGSTSATGGAVAKLWNSSIPVCWSSEVGSGLTLDGKDLSALESRYDVATLQRWAREAVENTWGRFAKLDFAAIALDPVTHEWSSCTSLSPSATIQISLTSGEDFADRGMRIDAPTRIRLHVPSTDRQGYSTSAIRLFGQALTILDSTQAGSLNPSDVALAQRLYARKHSGALVSWGGRCMGVQGAPEKMEQNNPFEINDCQGVPWRRLRAYENQSKRIQALAVSYGGAGYCPMVQGSSGPKRAVVTGPCYPGQDWAFRLGNMQWHGWGGLCVTAASQDAGAALALATCSTASTHQRWDLFDDLGAQLRLHANGRCVSIDSTYVNAHGGNLAGAPLTLAECSADDATQRFDLSVHDHIRYDATHCVQVDATQIGAGAALVLGPTCSPAAIEQLFDVAGQIEYASYGCLSLTDNLSYPGQAALMQPCQTLGDQIASLPEWQVWDYHW